MNQLQEKAKALLNKAAGMTKKLGKRNLTAICAVVLIAGALVMNFTFFAGVGEEAKGTLYYQGQNGAQAGGEGDQDNSPAGGAQDDYFAATILTRQNSRDEALAVLQTIVQNESALPESVSQAIAEMNQIAKDMENEANIETMVKAKGFEECVAVISGGKCSVIVKTQGLLPSHVAQIQEIVFEQAGILPENVKMIEKA